MTKLILTLAFSACFCSSAVAQDSLRDRLAAVNYFGVQSHEALSVTLHAYTKEQHEANLADLRQDETRRDEHREKVAEYKQQLEIAQEALRDNRTPAVMERYAKLTREGSPPLKLSDFNSKIRLHQKVTLGRDYISLTSIDGSDTEVMIPLSRIGRVMFYRSKPAESESEIP